MIAQDSASSVDRAIRFPATDPSTLNPEIPNDMLRAGRFLAFDNDGLPIASAGPTGNSAIPVSSFIEGLLDDSNAETARATLGLTIGTDVAPAGISGDFVGRVATFIGLTPPSGWLLLNGDTIGNLSSGADHESADFEDLFILFWDSMANAQAPVSTGRGASGSNDWIAGKTLTLPDARGRLVLGSGTGNSLSERVHGSTGGAEIHLLTANESGLRAHNHTYQRYLGGHVEGSLNGNPNTWFNVTTVNTSTVPAADASEAHNNMQPYLALNFIVKY